MPFMALLAEPERISTSPWLARAYARGGFVDTRSFIITAGVVVILLLALSRFLAVAVNYWRERYQYGVYERMSGRLLDYYLAKPYRYFLGQNTAALRSNIPGLLAALTPSLLRPEAAAELLGRCPQLVAQAPTCTAVIDRTPEPSWREMTPAAAAGERVRGR